MCPRFSCHLRFLLLVVLSFVAAVAGYAQSTYGNWQEIYKDNQIRIYIGYKESGSSCINGGRTNKYAYRIEGNLYAASFSVYSAVSYTDCYGQQKQVVNTINLGIGGALGLLEGSTYNYKGTQFKASPASANYNQSSANVGSTGANTQSAVWEPWIKLYTDNFATVFIRYKLSQTSCTQGGIQSKYKFKVEGTLRSSNCELPIQVIFTNCQGIGISNYHRLRLGTGGTLGEIESIDYRFTGSVVTGQTAGVLDCNQPVSTPVTPLVSQPVQPVVTAGSKPRKNPAQWGMWFKTGLDMGTRPFATMYTHGLNGNEVTAYPMYVINPFTIGWRADLEYSPIFVRGFGLSFNAGGAYGTGLAAISKLKPRSEEYDNATINSGEVKHTYYKLDFGGEVVMGWQKQDRAFLLLVRYQFHVNYNRYQSTINYTVFNNANGTETKTGVYNNRRETLYAGIRFRPGSPKFVMDLTFQLSKDYNWVWGFSGWQYKPTQPYQYGGGLAFSISNRKRINSLSVSLDIGLQAVVKQSGKEYHTSAAKEIFSRVGVLYVVGGCKLYKK
ncbi:MAG: hypothetical protein RLZZ367_1199 [Bacteroidota bacterium]|jgi:hypothetical protein